MALDLNRIAEKLKRQRDLGVNRDGTLQESNPVNDGTKEDNNSKGRTTLSPKRFFNKQ